MNFSAKFRSVLDISGLNKNTISTQLGIARSYFTTIEKGKTRISAETLGRVLTLVDHKQAAELLEAYLQDEASVVDEAYKVQLGKSKHGLSPTIQVTIRS
jgi:transcriptional regulator with XRE-family HTH domain